MDLTLYNIVISQLAEAPDLSIVQNKQPIPEAWPLVVKEVSNFRKQLQHFTVFDGKATAFCFTNVPEIEARVAALEIGSIIHLIGAETRFNDEKKCYVVDFEEICTLKEYDNRMKQQVEDEKNRLIWLKEQGYIEENNYSQMAPDESAS